MKLSNEGLFQPNLAQWIFGLKEMQVCSSKDLAISHGKMITKLKINIYMKIWKFSSLEALPIKKELWFYRTLVYYGKKYCTILYKKTMKLRLQCKTW